MNVMPQIAIGIAWLYCIGSPESFVCFQAESIEQFETELVSPRRAIIECAFPEVNAYKLGVPLCPKETS